MAVIDSGNDSAGKANVDAAFNLNTTLPTDPQYVGQAIAVSQIDDGSVTGLYETRTVDVDADFKLRCAVENILDTEVFDYAAQNTGKHSYATSTLTYTWSVNGLTSNGSGITSVGTGARVRTYAYFPLFGANQLYVQSQMSISAAPVSSTVVDWGFGLTGAANPFDPSDGVYFRLDASGISGVINFNGIEATVGPFDFTGIDGSPTYTPGTKYQFVIQISERDARFWINSILCGTIPVPSGQGRLCMAASAGFFHRHAIIGGAAGGVLQTNLNSYTVSLGGPAPGDTEASFGNRALGSYQGLSGGTMGTLANYANSTNPVSAAGSNTAANVTGLGGQGAINAAAAAATDFIMCSYQVPVGTVNVQGRRLAVRGVKISAINLGAAVATTPTTIALSLAFGHTSVSLATAEGIAAKAPRRIALGFLYWNVGAPAGATPDGGDCLMVFQTPIYVNPGEFIATVMKFAAGTATGGQSIAYHVTFDYGWE